MTTFNVRIPFAGEALSAFKSVTDIFAYCEDETEKVTRVSDDTLSFAYPITLGTFRLLLDGETSIVDRDFDSKVCLVSFQSKDRGGKGRVDASLRLTVDELSDVQALACECDLTVKGMLARVFLPSEEVFSAKIQDSIGRILEAHHNVIEIDDFASVEEPAAPYVGTVSSAELETLTSLVESGNLRGDTKSNTRWWVLVLQFPYNVFSYPFTLARKLFS